MLPIPRMAESSSNNSNAPYSLREPIEQAAGRMSGHVRRTALESSSWLADLAGDNTHVALKLENQQVTGSFKVRGAFNKIAIVASAGSASCQPVLASTGNHALACSWAAGCLNLCCEVHVPATVSATKLQALRHQKNLTVVLSGNDCVDAETSARAVAKDSGRPYVSPYNDVDVICGQGTIGKEILEDMPELDVLLVSVGGGGLISGIAAYVKAVKPSVKIIGCQPTASQVMAQSIAVGEIREFPQSETLSDGTAGGIEPGSVTFPLCQEFVDDWIMVSEETIAKAVKFMLEFHQQLVEGAAGVAVGAFLDQPSRFSGQHVAIVVCGGRLGIDKLREILG